MNITRMHILGLGSRVYQRGLQTLHVHEISVPHSRDGRGLADIWFITDVNEGLGPRDLAKWDGNGIKFTVIFTDRYGNQAILWSNEDGEQQAKAWESLGEGPLALG